MSAKYTLHFYGTSWTSLEIPTRRPISFDSLEEANNAAQRYLQAYTKPDSSRGEYDEAGLWNGCGASFLEVGEEMNVEVRVEEDVEENKEEGMVRKGARKGGRKKGRR